MALGENPGPWGPLVGSLEPWGLLLAPEGDPGPWGSLVGNLEPWGPLLDLEGDPGPWGGQVLEQVEDLEVGGQDQHPPPAPCHRWTSPHLP